MGNRKKPGRKPTERIRQHVMLDPENWDLLRTWACDEGRTLSDQINWVIRERTSLEAEMKRAGESSA